MKVVQKGGKEKKAVQKGGKELEVQKGGKEVKVQGRRIEKDRELMREIKRILKR